MSKRILGIILAVVLVLVSGFNFQSNNEVSAEEGTTTFQVAVPDANFRAFINKEVFGDAATLLDTAVLTSEYTSKMAELVGTLDVSDLMITNLQGISYFTGITILDCRYNQLSTIDVSKLTSLKTLKCNGNPLLGVDWTKVGNNVTAFDSSKAETTLAASYISTNCGVILPSDACEPIASTISDKGTYVVASKAIVWDNLSLMPASFTYQYTVNGIVNKTITVTVNIDKTAIVNSLVSVSNITNLTAASSAYNKIKLSWDNVDGCTGYRVYRSDTLTGTYTHIKSITKNSTITYTNSDRITGTAYYYKMRAYKLINGKYYFGSYTTPVSAKAVPVQATSLALTKMSSTTLKISWDKITGATGYRVYRSTSKDSGYTKIKSITSGSTCTYSFKPTKGIKYYYKVRAYRTVNGINIFGAYSTVLSKTF